MNPLEEQFVIEARELIAQATDDLIALERGGAGAQRAPAAEGVQPVLRAFHTLKGSAGVVALPSLGLIVHAAEDVLAAVHDARLRVGPVVIDPLLACLDQAARWVDEFEAAGRLSSQAGEQARAMAERLRDLLAGPARRDAAASRPGADALPDWVVRLSAQITDRARDELVAISYEPHPGCFFNGDDPVNLMRQVPGLLAFHLEPREPWPAIEALDPFACNLRLQAISAGDREQISAVFRLVPDQVQIIGVSASALWPEQTPSKQQVGSTELVRVILEEQRRLVQGSGNGADVAGRLGAAARAAANAARHIGLAQAAERIAQARAEADLLLSALDLALAELGAGTAAAAPLTGEADRRAGRLLRVDELKLDALVNLAGELIVAKNGLAYLVKQFEDELGGHALGSAFRRAHEMVERLAGKIHASVLQLRMVPLAQVFQSFPRLVRDLSRRLDKKVQLVTRGETTEADKAIVDRLFEPLLHLVRNAVDHGVETAEERRAAGKDEVATVSLQATALGQRFIIEVVDDGRGIDPALVRQRARQRQLIPQEELAGLSDEQVVELIFSAGFSTAREISDVSGRGVGMDVVRTTIEQIGGRASLASRAGQGTTVRLDLPISVAMSRIMVVESAGQLLGVPMEAVTETLRLTPDRISRVKNNWGFVLRDRIVPICSLAELMNLSATAPPNGGARLVIVTETSGRIAALEVDAIHDRLDVVLKPMQGLLAGARGYCGTTMLGDGRVLLVLDLKELLL